MTKNNTGKPADQLLTINEVAKMLRVHPETLRRWDNDGKLKSIRVSERGHRKYKKSDIEILLQSEK
jgi:DNA (cytosine-5)-methyltransferase 1